MGREVFIVVVLFRVLVTLSDCQSLAGVFYLFRAHKEEMLHSVGHAWHIICIAKASNINVDPGASFVCICIVNEKGFELVWQSYDTV